MGTVEGPWLNREASRPARVSIGGSTAGEKGRPAQHRGKKSGEWDVGARRRALGNDGPVHHRALYPRLLAALLTAAALGIGAGSASAQNVGTLDPAAATPGHLAQDSAGTAYVAWTRKSTSGAETPEFCKIPKGGGACASPITLPVPAPAESVDSPAGAFPVLGAGSTVYVVAPRYIRNDVLLYTSTDGGASFGPAQIVASSYSSKSNPSDVFLSGSEFLIGAYNAGLGFSALSTSGEGLGSFVLAEPGPGGVASESMALDSAGNPVQAWYNLNSGQYSLDFAHYNGSGSKTSEADWTGTQEVTKGYVPSLAGGASGLFLVSEDYNSPSESNPSVVDVRKYTGSSFGAPLRLFEDKNANLFDGGDIAQSPGGHVAVVWPQFGASQAEMRLLVSSNGGAGFTQLPNVAALGSSYTDQANAQLTIGDDNQGWVTFVSSAGLQLANLNSGAKGSGGTQTSHVGSDVITLSGPKGCVKPGQTVTVKLSVASAKRKHKVVLKVYQAIFGIDGKPFKKILRQSVRKTGKVNPHPFTAGVKRTFVAGSKHTISAQAFISERHGKHASRTLRISFLACS